MHTASQLCVQRALDDADRALSLSPKYGKAQ
jgi:hypothetical protein